MSEHRRVGGYLLRLLAQSILIGVPGALVALFAVPRLFVGAGNWLVAHGWTLTEYIAAWALIFVACIALVAYAGVRAFRVVSLNINGIRRSEPREKDAKAPIAEHR